MPRFKGPTPTEFLRLSGVVAALRAGLFEAAVELEKEWREMLGRPGSGRTYEEGYRFFTTSGAGGAARRVVRVEGSAEYPGRDAPHTASAEGEPPAPDSGLLQASVRTGRVDFQGDRATVRVGMGGERGRIGLALEFGVNTPESRVGPHPAENFRIGPRPHGRPAGAAATDNMTEAIRVRLAEAL